MKAETALWIRRMKILPLLLFSWLIFLLPQFTCLALAAEKNDSWSIPGFLEGISPDLGLGGFHRIRITPFGKFGYSKVGWTASLPTYQVISTSELAESGVGQFRLSLKEADLWLAEAGLEAGFVSGTSLMMRISGNILQDALNTWLPESRDEVERLLWKNRSVNWLEMEISITRPILGNLSMKTGLRYDDFRLAFKTPYEINAQDSSKKASMSFRGYQAESHAWIPYLGLGWFGEKFKLFLIGSVFAPSKISLESRISASSQSKTDVSCYTVFSSNEPASFIEINLGYAFRFMSLVNLSLWGKSGWLYTSGKGEITRNCSGSAGLSPKNTLDHDMTFSRYDISGGLSLDVSF